jgi:hypothetical protein
MKIDGRLSIVLVVVLVLIPGACATTASIGGGISISGSGSVQGNSVTNPVTNGVQTTGYTMATGAMKDIETHWLKDSTGKYAEVDVNVPSATSLTYKYSLSPSNSYDQKTISTAQSSIAAQEWLTATAATSIKADANAQNGEGDKANVGINMGPGSLTGYQNAATATMTQATGSQSATSASVASGKQIVYQSSAYNKELDDAWATAEVYGGSINGFADSATTTSISAIAKQSANSASGQVIWFLEQAQNNQKDTVGVQAAGSIYPNVGAIIQNGQLTSYSGSATATQTSVAKSVNIATLSGSSINFGPYAWNNEKDGATSILSSATGSISGYYDSASAVSTYATAYQRMNSITSSGATTIQGSSNNARQDSATANIYASKGTITSPTSNSYASAANDYVYPTASQINTAGTGSIYAYTSNPQGDVSNLNLWVTNGVITNPNFYAWSQPTITEAKLVSLTNAYGATETITSHAQNLAEARDPNSGSIKYGGSADFEALNTNGNKFTNPTVDTTATGTGDVTILSTGFSKTALLLEPFKTFGFGDIYNPVGSVGYTLEHKGYAVTDYSNAGVTVNKVDKLAGSTVSVFWGHGVVDSTTAINPNTVGLAISYDPTGSTNTQYIPWTQLQPYLTTPNGMIFLCACDPFNTNSYTTTFTDGTKTTTPGKYAVSKAKVSGGFVGSVLIADGSPYLDTLFTQLAAGATVSTANTAAANSISNRQKMTLQGNTGYTLP